MTSQTSTPPPIQSSAMNDDKPSGKLIIKAQLGDDIRKMMIHNEDLTLNELVLMMERIFAGKISNSDELTIKYLDDDGDKITLLNDSDLTVALNFHKVLRLFVFVNGNDLTSNNSTENANKEGDCVEAKIFRNELQQIRNAVETILDRLQLSTNEVPSSPPMTAPVVPTSKVVLGTARDFDPYKNLQQQQQQYQQYQYSATQNGLISNSNRLINNEHQVASTVDTKQVESSNINNIQSAPQMPTPHFISTGYHNDQQTKASAFGPPPTTFPGMQSLPTNALSQYSPAAIPNSNNSVPPPPTMNSTSTPPPSSMGQPSGFIGQQPPSLPQQGGFYGQQQALFQPRPQMPNFNPNNNAFASQQTVSSASNSPPATINPSYVQPPSMTSQQSYGVYPPQNSYYNPIQQYPKTS